MLIFKDHSVISKSKFDFRNNWRGDFVARAFIRLTSDPDRSNPLLNFSSPKSAVQAAILPPSIQHTREFLYRVAQHSVDTTRDILQSDIPAYRPPATKVLSRETLNKQTVLPAHARQLPQWFLGFASSELLQVGIVARHHLADRQCRNNSNTLLPPRESPAKPTVPFRIKATCNSMPLYFPPAKIQTACIARSNQRTCQ